MMGLGGAAARPRPKCNSLYPSTAIQRIAVMVRSSGGGFSLPIKGLMSHSTHYKDMGISCGALHVPVCGLLFTSLNSWQLVDL